MYRIIAAKSAPLYHGTSYKNAISIIESNELRANISNETETLGISFTRNKDSAYDKVAIVIDQEMLTYNYKIDPVYREGISGLDLAEERVPRTIHNIRRYITELRMNNPFDLKTLRRTIVDHFDDGNLLTTRWFSERDYNIACDIYQLLQCADKYKIRVDDQFKTCRKYIDMYINREFDTEYKNILDRRRANRAKRTRR